MTVAAAVSSVAVASAAPRWSRTAADVGSGHRGLRGHLPADSVEYELLGVGRDSEIGQESVDVVNI
jgi:hypothetical protein